jgi:hypothetical protein
MHTSTLHETKFSQAHSHAEAASNMLSNICRESRRKAELKEKYAKLRAQEGASAALTPEQPSG